LIAPVKTRKGMARSNCDTAGIRIHGKREYAMAVAIRLMALLC